MGKFDTTVSVQKTREKLTEKLKHSPPHMLRTIRERNLSQINM